MSATEDLGLVQFVADDVMLEGTLRIPNDSRSVVVFAHGHGGDRRSPRSQYLAASLREMGFATLLFNFLPAGEEPTEDGPDVAALTRRLVGATDWIIKAAGATNVRVGYFGAGTGGAAALIAATERPDVVQAIVTRGALADLAKDAIPNVAAPTLLIVGGLDTGVMDANREALRQLNCEKRFQIISGAGHLFEEPGVLEQVLSVACQWYRRFLP